MAMAEILQRPRDITRFEPDERWVLPKVLLGLEFEYEGVVAPPDTKDPHWAFWDTHRDDSLKDHGLEFVFKTPLFGVDAYSAIKWLMERAEELRYKCSSRCGIHVHLDVREMETSQWIGFIILYTILEPVLFEWIGDGRENSIYCVPFYKADESLREACACVRAALDDDTKDTSTILRTAKNFARYSALNLQALAKFGSVEFRHLKTTHRFERVVDWINMIMSLRLATEHFPTSDGAILALAQRMPPEEFLRVVFGDNLGKKLWTPEVPKLLKEKGFPAARDLVLFGLTKEPWRGFDPPKGKHAGFEKFLKGLPDVTQVKAQQVKKERLFRDLEYSQAMQDFQERNQARAERQVAIEEARRQVAAQQQAAQVEIQPLGLQGGATITGGGGGGAGATGFLNIPGGAPIAPGQWGVNPEWRVDDVWRPEPQQPDNDDNLP